MRVAIVIGLLFVGLAGLGHLPTAAAAPKGKGVWERDDTPEEVELREDFCQSCQAVIEIFAKRVYNSGISERNKRRLGKRSVVNIVPIVERLCVQPPFSNHYKPALQLGCKTILADYFMDVFGYFQQFNDVTTPFPVFDHKRSACVRIKACSSVQASSTLRDHTPCGYCRSVAADIQRIASREETFNNEARMKEVLESVCEDANQRFKDQILSVIQPFCEELLQNVTLPIAIQTLKDWRDGFRAGNQDSPVNYVNQWCSNVTNHCPTPLVRRPNALDEAFKHLGPRQSSDAALRQFQNRGGFTPPTVPGAPANMPRAKEPVIPDPKRAAREKAEAARQARQQAEKEAAAKAKAEADKKAREERAAKAKEEELARQAAAKERAAALERERAEQRAKNEAEANARRVAAELKAAEEKARKEAVAREKLLADARMREERAYKAKMEADGAAKAKAEAEARALEEALKKGPPNPEETLAKAEGLLSGLKIGKKNKQPPKPNAGEL